MADPAKDVRIAAAVALGAVGGESASLVLRLKVRLGDKDPEVFSESLGGLLAVNPKENLRLVTEFLEPSNTVACEAAALALGNSRLPEALDPLKECWLRSRDSELGEHLLLAIALLRRPNATDYLLELVASNTEETAIAVLSTLKIYKNDPHLRDRIAKLVHERKSGELQTFFDRAFRLDGD